jgi:hypothetical protein
MPPPFFFSLPHSPPNPPQRVERGVQGMAGDMEINSSGPPFNSINLRRSVS